MIHSAADPPPSYGGRRWPQGCEEGRGDGPTRRRNSDTPGPRRSAPIQSGLGSLRLILHMLSESVQNSICCPPTGGYCPVELPHEICMRLIVLEPGQDLYGDVR